MESSSSYSIIFPYCRRVGPIRELFNSITELCKWISAFSYCTYKESSLIELESSAIQLECSLSHLRVSWIKEFSKSIGELSNSISELFNSIGELTYSILERSLIQLDSSLIRDDRCKGKQLCNINHFQYSVHCDLGLWSFNPKINIFVWSFMMISVKGKQLCATIILPNLAIFSYQYTMTLKFGRFWLEKSLGHILHSSGVCMWN